MDSCARHRHENISANLGHLKAIDAAIRRADASQCTPPNTWKENSGTDTRIPAATSRKIVQQLRRLKAIHDNATSAGKAVATPMGKATAMPMGKCVAIPTGQRPATMMRDSMVVDEGDFAVWVSI
jgi:hypothetical protein